MKKILIFSVLLMSVSMLAKAQDAANSLFAVSTQDPSESSEIILGGISGLTFKPSLLSSESTIHKEVIAAAKEDAAIFGASEGQMEKSAVLAEAFVELQKIEGASDLSEIEQAQLVVLISEMN